MVLYIYILLLHNASLQVTSNSRLCQKVYHVHNVHVVHAKGHLSNIKKLTPERRINSELKTGRGKELCQLLLVALTPMFLSFQHCLCTEGIICSIASAERMSSEVAMNDYHQSSFLLLMLVTNKTLSNFLYCSSLDCIVLGHPMRLIVILRSARLVIWNLETHKKELSSYLSSYLSLISAGQQSQRSRPTCFLTAKSTPVISIFEK